MFVSLAHNIQFVIYWANCYESLPVNGNVVSIYSIRLEANRLDFDRSKHALSMRDTIVTFQDGADLVPTLFSIHSASSRKD